MRRRGISRIYLYPGIFIVAVFALAAWRIVALNWQQTSTPATPPATQAAISPSTEPATPPIVEEKPVVDLLDVLRADDPDYPTVVPLDLPSDLADAARVVVDRPVYLDVLGNLWITHPRGQSIDELLRRPIRKRTIVVNERVLHVHWPTDGGPPLVVARGEQGTSAFIYQRSLPPRSFNVADDHLRRTITVDDRVYRFIAAAEPGQPQALCLFHEIRRLKADKPPGTTQTVLRAVSQTPLVAAVAGEQLIVWGPWDNGQQGTDGAYVVNADGVATKLDRSNGWVDRPIHLVPLTDGAVLAIGRADNGVELVLKPLTETSPLTPDQVQKIGQLARRLADRDPLVREATQRELEGIGPSIFPELERIKDNLPVESQVRIEAILGQRFAPRIAGLLPLEGEVKTAVRFSDGGCVLLLTGGGVYEEHGEDQTLIPAWISIRPGHFLQRIDPSRVANFAIGQYKLAAFAGEWVIFDPTFGPQRWIGNRLYPLAGPDFRAFDEFVGIDAQRRWIFRSSTQPEKTLILDTSLPDLEPKLPVWAIDAPDGAGWTNNGWPAVKRGQAIFVLGERGWREPEHGETFDTTPPNVLSTSVTTPAGDRFYFTDTGLNVAPKQSGPTATTLPAGASAQPQLFWADDHLFVYNAPGTLHRFAWRKGGLKFEKTFDQNLPQQELKRIWLDPAGRLCMATETGVWISFPTGRVPSAISQLMLQGR